MPAMLGRSSAPVKAHTHPPTSIVRPLRQAVLVRALPGGVGDPTQTAAAQKLFQQHKVLLGAGFSYDHAALILQVSQQRRATLTSAGAAPTASDSSTLVVSAAAAAPAASSALPAAAEATAPAAQADTAGSSSSPAAMKTLEDRIAFLELELLKQALLNPTPLAADTDVSGSRNSSVAGSVPGSSRSRQGFSSTAAALNPAGAGAGGLNAAAAAAAGRWNADSVLDRQPQGAVGNLLSSSSSGGGDAPGPVIDAVSITTHLAAAAELGQLDPDVYALADALAVRRGFAGLSPAEPQPRAYGRLSTQQKQQRRPAGVWGRSAHYARPLSANAWGNSLYDPAGYGEPLITKQDLEEEVPSKPSGWAVVGTIVVVYLGVIVTFLAVCMGDVVSDIPL